MTLLAESRNPKMQFNEIQPISLLFPFVFYAQCTTLLTGMENNKQVTRLLKPNVNEKTCLLLTRVYCSV